MQLTKLSSSIRLGCGALAAVALLSACGDKDKKPAEKVGDKPASSATAGAPKPRDPLNVQLTPELNSLVKTGTLATADVREALKVAGRLDLNVYNTARIGAPVAGRISEVRAILGERVAQGQALASINSQELTAAQLSFLKAHSAQQLMTRAVERAELLLSADVIGAAELQRRQSELTVARAEKRAAADQLRVLGLSPRSVDELEKTGKLIAAVPISATQSGTVIERKITVGQVVQPSDSLFVVSNLNSLWAQAEVPEQEATSVKLGQKVEIVIPALNNEKRVGKIVFVSDVVNPETRTVRVGVDLENGNKELKPQMLITMLIEGRPTQKMVVPSSAIVREDNNDFLFIEKEPGVARLTPVKLGAEKSGMRPILDSFPQGQRIITEGAFHLNNERIKRNLETKG